MPIEPTNPDTAIEPPTWQRSKRTKPIARNNASIVSPCSLSILKFYANTLVDQRIWLRGGFVFQSRGGNEANQSRLWVWVDARSPLSSLLASRSTFSTMAEHVCRVAFRADGWWLNLDRWCDVFGVMKCFLRAKFRDWPVVGGRFSGDSFENLI